MSFKDPVVEELPSSVVSLELVGISERLDPASGLHGVLGRRVGCCDGRGGSLVVGEEAEAETLTLTVSNAVSTVSSHTASAIDLTTTTTDLFVIIRYHHQRHIIIYTVSQKTAQIYFFLSELCQIWTDCENFWHKSRKEDMLFCDVLIFHLT